MKKLYSLLAMCLLINISIAAQDKTINIATAGALGKMLTETEMQSITSIKVTGNINAADAATLAKMSRENKLAGIDLSEALWVAETKDPVLDNPEEYFLPMIAILGKPMDPDGFTYEEETMGHTRDPKSVPGFWMFQTHKTLFPLTGYMNGWEGTIDEAVLKSYNVDWIRSQQVRSWIESMGYVYSSTRDDGDDIFYNQSTKVWAMLHYTPYNSSDFPGIHFSLLTYEY